MIRNIRLFAIAVVCLPIALAFPGRSEAAIKTPIYAAADEYREAVRRFEFHVLRTPNVRQSAERSVDCLENSTSRLKTAARDPERFDRLYDRFVQTDALHARIELIFFGSSLYPADPILEDCWSDVAETHSRLVQEIIYLKALRQSRRGYSVPIVDHSADYLIRPLGGPLGASASLTGSNSYYRGEYAATRLPESIGVRPTLQPQVDRPAVPGEPSPSLRSASTSPQGGRLERDNVTYPRAEPIRRRIRTREELRSAVIGAMLQRK